MPATVRAVCAPRHHKYLYRRAEYTRGSGQAPLLLAFTHSIALERHAAYIYFKPSACIPHLPGCRNAMERTTRFTSYFAAIVFLTI